MASEEAASSYFWELLEVGWARRRLRRKSKAARPRRTIRAAMPIEMPAMAPALRDEDEDELEEERDGMVTMLAAGSGSGQAACATVKLPRS